MKYYRNLHIDDNYMMALLLDNESMVRCYTEEDVNKCCTVRDNTTSITVNETIFIKNQVKSVYFGNGWNLDNIPKSFCRYFSNLTHLDPLPDMITSISNYFMFNCKSFNQPLTIPESVTSIGSSFIYSCASFNHPLNIPNSITSISNYFMFNCKSFNQPLTIPESVTSIGNTFMRDCTSFNQPLTLPSSITSIDIQFMYNCKNFTGPLEILFTDPNVFTSGDSLGTEDKTDPMYSTGVTITGNMTGAQLRTVLPNSSVYPFRRIR